MFDPRYNNMYSQNSHTFGQSSHLHNLPNQGFNPFGQSSHPHNQGFHPPNLPGQSFNLPNLPGLHNLPNLPNQNFDTSDQNSHTSNKNDHKIIDWGNVLRYFYDVDFSGTLTKYQIGDDDHLKSFLDHDVVPYIDKIKKRNFSRLLDGENSGCICSKTLIRDFLNHGFSDSYHFSVKTKYDDVRLEFMSEDDKSIVGIFIQDGDEFIMIFYTDGHLNIITDEIYFSNTDGNTTFLPHPINYEKITDVHELIELSYYIMFEMLRNQAH